MKRGLLVLSHISERAQITTNHRETSRKEFCKGKNECEQTENPEMSNTDPIKNQE